MARYVAKFCKSRDVKFISHLDLMRCFQRCFRRVEIPISYSQGFNPHAQFSFATPLPVGTWSVSEYMDMALDEEWDCRMLVDELNRALPGGIRIYSAFEADEQMPSLMSMVSSSAYDIELVNLRGRISPEEVESFLAAEHIGVLKVRKGGESSVDIKPMIRKLAIKSGSESGVVLSTVVDSGSAGNLSPGLLIDGLRKYISRMEGADVEDIVKNATLFRLRGREGALEELLGQIGSDGCEPDIH